MNHTYYPPANAAPNNDDVDDDVDIPTPASASASAYTNTNTNHNNESPVFLLNQITNLLKLSTSVSSKVLTPALLQLFQTSAPALTYYYKQLTPARIKEWIQILTSAIHNLVAILSQTPKGQHLLHHFNALCVHLAHLLTSTHARNLIVHCVGAVVQAIEALHTPQVHRFLAALPVSCIRILDFAASGEAKLFYHALAQLLWGVVDMLGQEETFVALAEFAALLVHALQKERDAHGSWNYRQGRYTTTSRRRRRRSYRSRNRNRSGKRNTRRKKVKLVPRQQSRKQDMALNSKRRKERNQFVKETYTDRVMLHDVHANFDDDDDDDEEWSDHSVEDAILSSLGDGTRMNVNLDETNPNAWLNFMGREQSQSQNQNPRYDDEDAASLPSNGIIMGFHTIIRTRTLEFTLEYDFLICKK
jgi:hypothetical protein